MVNILKAFVALFFAFSAHIALQFDAGIPRWLLMTLGGLSGFSGCVAGFYLGSFIDFSINQTREK